jgi:aspartate/glutamate racemase
LITGIRHLQSCGADLVIKGCTEIALAIPEEEFEGMPLIDPAISLARALIAAVEPSKLKPLPK